MEHGRNRHVDVVRLKAAVRSIGKRKLAGHGMQHQLTMAEVHALGQPRSAGGIEGRGAGVLVQLGELVVRVRAAQHVFVFGVVLDGGLRRFAGIVQKNDLFHRVDLVLDRLEQGQEFGVDQNDIVLGMIDGVQHLIRRQAHVHHVQHGTHHRNAVEAFQVTMGIPIHHRHGVAGLHAQPGQTRRQTPDTLSHLLIGKAELVGVNDLLLGRRSHSLLEHVLDKQGIGISRRCTRDDIGSHAKSPPD